RLYLPLFPTRRSSDLGALQYVPFAALPLPGWQPPAANNSRELRTISYHPLIVNHEVVSLPSVSVLTEVRKDFAKRQPGDKTIIRSEEHTSELQSPCNL